jgi:replicative DNA helicase
LKENNMEELKTQSLELDTLNSTEQIVLATAMKSPNALPDILMNLIKDDFNQSAHKVIFEAIVNLNQDNKEISELTIIDELDKHNKLAKAGNSSYILEIANQYYTDRGIETYIRKVYEASQGRKFRSAVASVTDLLKQSKDMHAALEYAQAQFIEIDFDLKKSDTIGIGQSARAVIEKTKKLSQTDNHLTGVGTGYARLDNLTSGFQAGDFIILAARPSMGKTAFALNLAYNSATSRMQKNSVAIFSLEMPSEQLTQRILSSMTGIPADRLRNGKGIDKDG